MNKEELSKLKKSELIEVALELQEELKRMKKTMEAFKAKASGVVGYGATKNPLVR